ncbi:PepSY-associated TM helix domain-containing protein [Amycolatopsis rhabdoformis]|uniref:PepSY-associated TM helix domain-containing protein n=1 Tax=Amycolatopsis rhabdoformis TaxID=1448059 RepID=A0ABZ1I657_9PSEU|nr:PepSY-associated TM helix domain-containing protein [Amycolatopsis rhabdoformis]WSE29709.1 PepSY-associated TM helix domain-containing protein [Amycolatopsis rhabdoformis]
MSTDELTRTEAAGRGGPVGGGRKAGRVRRWLRRRPVRRALVVTHRWTSLVLGLFLVLETTSGAILLYHAEYFRATHSEFYRHTPSEHPVSLQQARDIVAGAHPEFSPAWVSNDGGVIAVGDPDFAVAYAVDPGTGRINGSARLEDGVMGFLANVHDCGLTCEGYPGYVSWLAKPVPSVGFAWPPGTSWGLLALVVLGLLMVLLAISGIVVWWPGVRRLSHGFRVRTGKGRFARDYDLHNVLGIVAVPFVLMWGVTGAAFYLPPVKDAWLAVTGGAAADPQKYSFTANANPGAPEIGIDEAARAALATTPGEIRYLTAPQDGYYSVSIASDGYQPYGARAFFGGDHTVYVDSHDATHVSDVDAKPEPRANSFYDKVFEPAHFGWLVGGWWRIVWFVLGLTPLALMLTGISTWLFRSGSKRRRRKARAARQAHQETGPAPA